MSEVFESFQEKNEILGNFYSKILKFLDLHKQELDTIAEISKYLEDKEVLIKLLDNDNEAKEKKIESLLSDILT